MPKRKQQQHRPRVVEHVSDSEDEEIPEEEAFDSDDERKYGSFFKNDDDNSVEESGNEAGGSSGSESSDSDSVGEDGSDDDDNDGGEYMLSLLEQLEKKEHRGKDEEHGAILSHTKESEFSSSVVRKTDLTLDSLMKGLEDTKGFGVIQKQMKKVVQGKATSAPLARVISDRAKRKVHYDDQSKEISMWLDAVQQNRQAETLDFRPKQRRGDITSESLVEKFTPTTKFEKEMHAALQRLGQEDENAILKKEERALQDDLGANRITVEDYKRRRAELAKSRALMFYFEQKQHMMKKIKSKNYRRIRKKQREKMKETELDAQLEENPDLAREIEEKEEVERMKERMTLAHSNTSKWAKRVLKRGKNADVETRRALSAQLKRGDDLLKRMTTTRSGEEDDDEDGDGSDEEDLIRAATKVLEETENENDEAIQGNGLFKLSFMQRGIERQRQRAKEEARKLLRALEEDDNDETFDELVENEHQKISKRKVASKEEMKNVIDSDELVASALKFGNSNSTAVTGDIDINVTLYGEDKTKGGVSNEGRLSLTNAEIKVAKCKGGVETVSATAQNVPEVKRGSKIVTKVPIESDEPNPWLASTKNEAEQKDSKVKKKPRTTGMVDVEAAVDILDAKKQEKSAHISPSGQHDGESASADNKNIISLTQEELVKRAFASGYGKEADEEFQKEKLAMEEAEDPSRKRKKEKALDIVSGWGSWTGKGAPLPRPPRKLPKHLQPPEAKKEKRKRADEKKPNVIISEKRLKKMADSYMLAEVPYPFTTQEEYAKSMDGPLGREWNATKDFKAMTRPDILTRSGKIIQPISKKVKKRRPAAKF